MMPCKTHCSSSFPLDQATRSWVDTSACGPPRRRAAGRGVARKARSRTGPSLEAKMNGFNMATWQQQQQHGTSSNVGC